MDELEGNYLMLPAEWDATQRFIFFPTFRAVAFAFIL